MLGALIVYAVILAGSILWLDQDVDQPLGTVIAVAPVLPMAYIIDKKGERVEHAGLETTRQGENEAGIAYLFSLDNGIEGCRFVYETPALIIRMPISYELKNIELP